MPTKKHDLCPVYKKVADSLQDRSDPRPVGQKTRGVYYLLLFLFLQIRLVETSAKHKVHVDKAFHDLVRVIRKGQKPDPSEKKKKKRRWCTLL